MDQRYRGKEETSGVGGMLLDTLENTHDLNNPTTTTPTPKTTDNYPKTVPTHDPNDSFATSNTNTSSGTEDLGTNIHV
jgi:hypothetical protein